MTAMILEKLGFDLIYMTGYGTAAAMGMPDVGLATIGEMIRNAQYMANAVSIPIIADSDTGGGNAINVVRTIREYIQAGVAGIHIEDQEVRRLVHDSTKSQKRLWTGSNASSGTKSSKKLRLGPEALGRRSRDRNRLDSRLSGTYRSGA